MRPTVQDDGGDIKYISFDDKTGILTIAMLGSCAGCPSSSATLKNGIFKMMKHYVGEVKDVVAQDFKPKWNKYYYVTLYVEFVFNIFVIFIKVLLSTWEEQSLTCCTGLEFPSFLAHTKTLVRDYMRWVLNCRVKMPLKIDLYLV